MTATAPVEPELGAPASMRAGTVWAAGAALGVAAANYLYSLGMAYWLPVAHYAVFAAGQAELVAAGTIAAAAAPWLLAAQVAAHRGDATSRQRAIGFSYPLNLGQGVAAAAFVALIAATFAGPRLAGVLAVTTVLTFVASTSVGYLQGMGRFRAIAAYRVLEAATKVAAGGLGVLAGLGAGAALGGFTAAALVMTTVGAWVLRHDLAGAAAQAASALRDRRLWLAVGGLGGLQALVAVLMNLDTIAVAVLPLDRTGAATYQVAATLSKAPAFAATALSMVAFRAVAARTEPTAHLLTRCLRWYLPGAGLLAAVLATAPPELTTLLLPTAYRQLAPVLAWTAATGVLLGLINLLSTFFQAERRFAAAARPMLLAVLVQVVGVGIGSRWGTPGVAAGAFCGAATGAGAMALLAHRTWWPDHHRLGRRLGARRVLVALAPACAGVLALTLANAFPPGWVALVLGLVLAYALALRRAT